MPKFNTKFIFKLNEPKGEDSFLSESPATLALNTSGALALNTSGAELCPAETSVPGVLLSAPPRSVKLNQRCGRKSPLFWQTLSLLNPVFLLVLLFCWCVADDLELVKRGVDCQGKIVNVGQPYGRKAKQKSNVNYQYTYAGKSYRFKRSLSADSTATLRAGEAIAVRVLPERPSTHIANFFPQQQTMSSQLARSTTGDEVLLSQVLILVLVFESVIWCIPLLHLFVVRNGKAVLAEITEKKHYPALHGSVHYYICYRFECNEAGASRIRQERMLVTRRQYDAVQTDTKMTVVYLPGTPFSLLYRYAYFHAT